MIPDSKQRDILLKVAKKYNKSPYIVERMWASQFKLLESIMRGHKKDEDGYYVKDSFKSLKMLHFGKFVPLDYKIEKKNEHTWKSKNP